MRSRLPFKESVHIVAKSGILADDITQQFFVFSKLSFQIATVPEIDFILKLVNIKTFVQSLFKVSKEIVDLHHSISITSINELS